MTGSRVGLHLIAGPCFHDEGPWEGNAKVLFHPTIPMKQRLHLIITAYAASVLTVSALAQPSANTGTDHPDYSRQSMPHGRQADRLNGADKASDVIGLVVKNYKDGKLGRVENLLVDLSSGRIVAVVISSGGFIGIGDELSAVPTNALRSTSDREALQLDASKEMLAASPHFKATEWPDFSQPDYAGGIYRAYKAEPYFTTNLTADADNSGRNVRDRGGRNLTPLDQGNSQADIDTTALIRRGIIAGKNMSVSARNVKAITNNGRVTLRGPVNSAEEKRLIGEIAGNIALVENVENQLDVK